MRLFLDEMAKTAGEYGAGFGFVSLDKLMSIMNGNRIFGSAGENRWNLDLLPSFPLLDANYPVDYQQYRELRTKPTKFDDGHHPGPRVHSYYADAIATWLQRPEAAGRWIGPVVRRSGSVSVTRPAVKKDAAGASASPLSGGSLVGNPEFGK